MSLLRSILGALKWLAICVIPFLLLDTLVIRHMGRFQPLAHFSEEIHHQPFPYIAFKGKPGALDHNEMGFRGRVLPGSDSSFKVVFFGGSTGYNGKPPIPEMMEQQLQARGLPVEFFNLSVVSSHHRQHLHSLVENALIHEPDAVVFYGGANETAQHVVYDPRPGYPYNFFYREETPPWKKLLLSNFASLQMIERRFQVFTHWQDLRDEQEIFSDRWRRALSASYLETLALSAQVTRSTASDRCGEGVFLAFYQPFQVAKPLRPLHEEIRSAAGQLDYLYDVSQTYQDLESPYTDVMHVKQEARQKMAETLAPILERVLRERCGLRPNS